MQSIYLKITAVALSYDSIVHDGGVRGVETRRCSATGLLHDELTAGGRRIIDERKAVSQLVGDSFDLRSEITV